MILELRSKQADTLDDFPLDWNVPNITISPVDDLRRTSYRYVRHQPDLINLFVPPDDQDITREQDAPGSPVNLRKASRIFARQVSFPAGLLSGQRRPSKPALSFSRQISSIQVGSPRSVSVPPRRVSFAPDGFVREGSFKASPAESQQNSCEPETSHAVDANEHSFFHAEVRS